MLKVTRTSQRSARDSLPRCSTVRATTTASDASIAKISATLGQNSPAGNTICHSVAPKNAAAVNQRRRSSGRVRCAGSA
jgi:hypothetical protein